METKTCKNCGADYHFNWGDDLCYGCVKDQHVTAVLSDQEFTGVPVEMTNDAFANAYPPEGAKIDAEGFVLKTNWEYKTNYCFRCNANLYHTVMVHADAVDKKLKEIAQLEQNAKDAIANKAAQKTNWNLLSSKRCLLCQEEIPHTNAEHYLRVELYEIEPFELKKKKDTSSGHIPLNSINFPKTNAPIVSEIRPFTYEDRVEVEKRKLSSRLTKQLDAYNIVDTLNSDGIADPAKDSGYVTGGYVTGQSAEHVNVMPKWWEHSPVKYNEMVFKEARWMSMDEWKNQIKKNPELRIEYWNSISGDEGDTT